MKQDDLNQFTGTTSYYKLNVLFPNILLTDGVKYLADEAQCYWLLEAIASNIYNRSDWFMNIEFNSKSGRLVITDGNGIDSAFEIVENFGSHTFPLESINLYAQNDGERIVIMLPSEY